MGYIRYRLPVNDSLENDLVNCKKRKWTEEELEYLFDNYGKIPSQEIAVKLNRTQHAVKNKLARSGVSIFHDFYTATLLGNELNRNKSTVMKWYKNGWLKGAKSRWTRGYLTPPMIFQEENIVCFLKKHKDLFSNHKIPNLYFRNVMLSD